VAIYNTVKGIKMKNTELQQIVEGGNVPHPLVIQETDSTVAINSCVPAALEDFYVHPYGKPGHALDGLFHQAARLMRASGVAAENIQAGLIILSVVSSIQMETPLSAILRVQNDTATADHLLSTCLRFVNPASILEIQRLKPDELFSSGNHFQNKVIICRDLPGLKKVEPDLRSLIINGKATIQATFKGKHGTMTSDIEVHGPVAFIGIEKEDEPQLFDHPVIIRIPVSECPSSFQFDEGTVDKAIAVDFEIDRVAEYLSRFRARKVSIPYERQLSAAILRQRPIHYIQKNGFVRNLLAILTMLNNPEPVDKTSFLAKLINSRPEHIQEYLRINGADSPPVAPGDVELVSGKMEYFVMEKLLKGIIPLKHQSPSLLRKQIFDVVKRINLLNIASSTISQNDTLEILYTLNYFELYWAKIDIIYKRINKARTDIIPIAAIEAELAAIKKMGFIERKKFKDRDEYGYFIATLTIDDEVKFPGIVELFGACSDEQQIEVINPITGQIEKI
jgi:hypothetical protein